MGIIDNAPCSCGTGACFRHNRASLISHYQDIHPNMVLVYNDGAMVDQVMIIKVSATAITVRVLKGNDLKIGTHQKLWREDVEDQIGQRLWSCL